MTVEATIAAAIAPFAAVEREDGGVAVTTSCLFPNNDAVVVRVFGGPQTFRVSDDGAGWSALLGSGLDPAPSQSKRAHAIATASALSFADGSFVADEVDPGALGAAIVVVANATQRWVSDVLNLE